MIAQAKKNLRQAIPSAAFGSPGWEAMQAAVGWVDKQDVGVSNILDQLGLLTIAQRCLVAGETLEEVGAEGPYGTTAQRRAWAAGRLEAACRAMLFADQVVELQTKAAARIVYLEKKVELLRAETRAAARFNTINVPFREKAPVRVDWAGE
ncbi:hypothetical protein [Shinella granuli]|uniref:Uncharacterized protein n=1 Tax=Shinella granuli TaxID=323621 RepID=A0A4R2CNP3_SHIGR|nr:hypothetical protein [Shinella granuli]TCN42273.1 hypothetical protein EV665_1127 [Shinella granuli]